MKNFFSFLTLAIAVLVIAVAGHPKALALVENQIVGFFGVSPVQQQPATQDLILTLKNYGFIPASSSATPLLTADVAIQTGTTIVSGTIPAGTLRTSGTSLYIATGSNTWVTK